MNASPIPLYQAKTLYQAVGGTSSSSKYFVVAIGDGLKIAARIRSNRVSIRAEGDVKAHKNQLKAAGLAPADGGHWSMHVEYDNDPVMARRIVGSVLCSLDINAVTPLPKVQMLVNQGK
jgi:hypothetical protein